MSSYLKSSESRDLWEITGAPAGRFVRTSFLKKGSHVRGSTGKLLVAVVLANQAPDFNWFLYRKATGLFL